MADQKIYPDAFGYYNLAFVTHPRLSSIGTIRVASGLGMKRTIEIAHEKLIKVLDTVGLACSHPVSGKTIPGIEWMWFEDPKLCNETTE